MIFILWALLLAEVDDLKPSRSCEDFSIELLAEVHQFLEQDRFFDAHILALLGQAQHRQCEISWLKFRLLDAHSLWKLGDHQQAIQLLDSNISVEKLNSSWKNRFDFYRAWIILKNGDDEFFLRWLDNQPDLSLRRRGIMYLQILNEEIPPTALTALAKDALVEHNVVKRFIQDIDALDTPSPVLAGVLNGILPGGGYAALGMWQSAGISFLLNAITIGATIEFAQRKLYFSASASGLLASFFYVGGIVGAASTANEIGNQQRQNTLTQLERSLFSELIY